MVVALVLALSLVGVALFVSGWYLGQRKRRASVDPNEPASRREVREQADRVIVAVLSEQAERRQAAEDARRAKLYGRADVARDTLTD